MSVNWRKWHAGDKKRINISPSILVIFISAFVFIAFHVFLVNQRFLPR